MRSLLVCIYIFAVPIGVTSTETTTPIKSGSVSNVNERAVHTSYINKTGDSPSDTVLCHSQDIQLFFGLWGLTFLQKILTAYSKPRRLCNPILLPYQRMHFNVIQPFFSGVALPLCR